MSLQGRKYFPETEPPSFSPSFVLYLCTLSDMYSRQVTVYYSIKPVVCFVTALLMLYVTEQLRTETRRSAKLPGTWNDYSFPKYWYLMVTS